MGIDKYKVNFTLSELKKLPVGLETESEAIRTVYVGFEGLGPEILNRLDVGIEGQYAKFIKRELHDWHRVATDLIAKHDSGEIVDIRQKWRVTSLVLIYEAIYWGHVKIDSAYVALLKGNRSEFAGYLSEAGVLFGKLLMIYDLLNRNVFEKIGSLQSALVGAAKGGKASGVTRRKQSRVPTPEKLREAHKKLAHAGKPLREISAMLAKKYDCTTDHIRKVLKRD